MSQAAVSSLPNRETQIAFQIESINNPHKRVS